MTEFGEGSPKRGGLRLWKPMVLIAVFAPIFCWMLPIVVEIGEDILAPNSDEIHAMGETLAVAIESRRTAHGRYPDSFAEAGLTSPTSYQGGFRYRSNVTDFDLTIGIADGSHVKHVYKKSNPPSSGDEWSCVNLSEVPNWNRY